MRTLAIGDIHGCDAALRALLEKVRPESTDQVIFLGDYIDRGPASRAVIDTLLELRKACATVFLRGNHEVMILEARSDSTKANLWQSYGGLETLVSYGVNYDNYGPDWVQAIPVAHWEFLERTTRYFANERHIFVHACLDPELNMEEQPDWLLYWEYFDRLQPHSSEKRIICGHSPQRSGQIKDVGFAACLDTGPASGGWLTCLDVDSGKYWQANENGSVRDGVLSQ
jgi:serine/threonine protein phosphatase 1